MAFNQNQSGHLAKMSPCNDAKAVTADDDNDLPDGAAKALYIGGSGNINLDTIDGTTVVFNELIAGSILPVRVARVRSTSTTATNIVALY